MRTDIRVPLAPGDARPLLSVGARRLLPARRLRPLDGDPLYCVLYCFTVCFIALFCMRYINGELLFHQSKSLDYVCYVFV